MTERRDDRIKDIAGTALEALVSAIPLVGGPGAVLINRAVGSARQRRYEAIVESIRLDLDSAIAAGRIGDVENTLTSARGLAAIERVLRASQEASTDEKVGLLRAAMVSGFAADWDDLSLEFLSIAERLETQHIRILSWLAEHSTGAYIPHIVEYARQLFLPDHEVDDDRLISVRIGRWLRELVSEGLIGEQMVEDTGHLDVLEKTVGHRISYLGLAFLNFLSGDALPDFVPGMH
jgi:hypothetical protein